MLFNLLVWKYFHNFAAERVSLKERESSFCSTFEDKNNRHTKENRNSMTIASVKKLRHFYAVE